MSKEEYIIDILKEMTEESLIREWNLFADNKLYKYHIYENTNEAFESLFHNDYLRMAYLISRGNYYYMDRYFSTDCLGSIFTFTNVFDFITNLNLWSDFYNYISSNGCAELRNIYYENIIDAFMDYYEGGTNKECPHDIDYYKQYDLIKDDWDYIIDENI